MLLKATSRAWPDGAFQLANRSDLSGALQSQHYARPNDGIPKSLERSNARSWLHNTVALVKN